ncbi:MAG: efflux RND transporter periplasmic adaptor subunit [Planctomycetaceae bacterium]|nr:efflux RND transporter periplasmic adaptor subunit [Planctomycetaceae bacterium]
MSKSSAIIRRWSGTILKIVIIGSVISGLVYWMKFSPISVQTVEVSSGTLIAEVMGTGTLEARIKSTVSPKISGRIEAVLVDQGDRVTSGQLLIQLDDLELQQQVAIAQANIDSAIAAIERLKSEKVRATAVYEQAQRNHGRVQGLVKQNVATQDEADTATESLEVAAADVSRSQAAIIEGQQSHIAAQKNLEYHRAKLQDTHIKAPFDGLIVRRNREPGDVVVPGSSVLTLISTEELWISAWVDETEMAKLKKNQSANVQFRSEASKTFPGKVARLGQETDRETREFIVDVQVLELPSNWAVGQRAEVYIEVARKENVIQIPATLVIRNAGQVGVYILKNDHTQWQPITLGLRSREHVEVTEGLEVGSIVITPIDENISLSQGRKVFVP